MLFDGRRLAQARHLAGRLKSEIANEVALSAAAIGQFESEAARPSAVTLEKLADALDVPPAFFAANRPRFDVTEAVANFRSLRSTSQRDRARARAQVEILAEVVHALDRRLQLPGVDLPTIDWDVSAGDAAQIVRETWQLGAGPITHVVRLLETKGVIVSRLPAATDVLDAFSCWIGTRPFVVLVANKGAADRARFDAAHELAHLVFHHEVEPGDTSKERVAHAFAAEFLTPTESIRDHLPSRLDWRRLADLKIEWGVSMAMLLRRMRDLGRISDVTFRRGMMEMSRRGWRRTEPVEIGAPEAPELLARAVRLLEGMAVSSVDELADELAIRPTSLRSLVAVATSDARESLTL